MAQDYNWEMTGSPAQNSWVNEPEAIESWNDYVKKQQDLGGGFGLDKIVDPNATPAEGEEPKKELPPNWLNPADYLANKFDAPYTREQIEGLVDPNWIRQMAGQTYASVKGPNDLSGGEYLIDPNTGKFALDEKGNPVGVTYPKSNNFDDWMTTPAGQLAGLMLPLLAAGGIGAAGALGAGGTGAGFGLTGASTGTMGLTGASTGTMGLTAASVPSLAGGLAMPTAGALAGTGAGALAASEGLGSLGSTLGTGSSALGSTASTVGQALPYTEAFDAINLANQGIGASQIESILATQGVDPFMAADIAGMASNGLSEAAIMQNLAGGYTAAELAPLGMAPASWSANAAASGLAGKSILDKLTKGLNGLGSALGGGGGLGGGSGKGVNIQALKGTVAGGGNYAGPEQWHNLVGRAEGGPIGDQDEENEEQNGYFDAQDMSFLADGGLAHDNYAHNPQFFSEGGLNSLANRFVQGPGTATSDEVPAMLSNGEYVLPAHVVKAVGDGSNKKGAKVLDDFLNTVKKHKEKHDGKVSPKQTKGALGALLERKK